MEHNKPTKAGVWLRRRQTGIAKRDKQIPTQAPITVALQNMRCTLDYQHWSLNTQISKCTIYIWRWSQFYLRLSLVNLWISLSSLLFRLFMCTLPGTFKHLPACTFCTNRPIAVIHIIRFCGGMHLLHFLLLQILSLTIPFLHHLPCQLVCLLHTAQTHILLHALVLRLCMSSLL